MNDRDLERYSTHAMDGGAIHAVRIDPASVATAPWVRFKCQFGCRTYGIRYSCPPDSPTPEQTRAILDCYRHAILFQFQVPSLMTETECSSVMPLPLEKAANEMDRIGVTRRYREQYSQIRDMLVKLEGEAFKDGYYKAFVFFMGSCGLCETCAKVKGQPCLHRYRMRPSMEASGIDVFQTVRNSGITINALTKVSETRNQFGLLLVD